MADIPCNDRCEHFLRECVREEVVGYCCAACPTTEIRVGKPTGEEVGLHSPTRFLSPGESCSHFSGIAEFFRGT